MPLIPQIVENEDHQEDFIPPEEIALPPIPILPGLPNNDVFQNLNENLLANNNNNDELEFPPADQPHRPNLKQQITTILQEYKFDFQR